MEKNMIKDALITGVILVCAFFLSILFQNVFGVDEHISTLFAFAVFLISLLTNGYACGIISAFIATLAINFAFTFPYLAFNFTIPINLISAIIIYLCGFVAFFRYFINTQIAKRRRDTANSNDVPINTPAPADNNKKGGDEK